MLELKNICKKFGDKVIFDNFNLVVADKELLTIVGPSGGGKTTLLRMLAGLESIDSGEIIYNGQVISHEDGYVRGNILGFVFQDFQLFPNMTVLDNLILSPTQTMGMSKEDAIHKAQGFLNNLGIGEQENSYPSQLSGGQKQRVALARAMMIDPKIIGYDEPTSALDPGLRDQVADLILENKRAGITQIVVTHDMKFAETIADTILAVNSKED
ncbi:amino acid ABC transporter ATP-binding protein [Streptococcaceae bacterium ESL0729]|nr:amino acid ABC transporter ATP-binding protein [Streptococcaceae bacterium ESL0729]